MKFANFPTPYPDEVLYSILCRYHIRSANPGANTTREEIWGYKESGKSLYLPCHLDKIVSKLPEGTGITVDDLIWNHTMYPYVKPVLPKERAEYVYEVLSGIREHSGGVYTIAGLLGRRLPLPQFLRFCPECVKEDVDTYGETYWHRIHQLPGVLICPKHKTYIINTECYVNSINRHFIPLDRKMYSQINQCERFSSKTESNLLSFAEDSMWLLKNGNNMGFLEDTRLKYKEILIVKGYRAVTENAPVNCERMNSELTEYYGKEFLGVLCADKINSYRNWSDQFLHKTVNPPTSHYLLLARFLCGSPQKFNDFDEVFKPFGDGPWPCRNPICEYNLKDCIEKIDINFVVKNFKAVFTCPHCGFSYRRGKATPKEQQYAGQVKLEDFGWLWKEKLKQYLGDDKLSVHKTAQLLKVCDDTVLIYGIRMGLLPEERMPKPRVFKPKEKILNTDTSEEIKQKNRTLWTEIMQAHPEYNRSELSRINQNLYKYFLDNDKEWFEANVPKRKTAQKQWEIYDNDCYEKAVEAIEKIKSVQGRPKWICLSAIGYMIGIGNSMSHIKSKIPKTLAYLQSEIETKTEWRKRKIDWAINELHSAGIMPTLYKVQLKSGISRKMYLLLREYADEEIKKLIEKYY